MTQHAEREASPDEEVGFTLAALFRGAALDDAQRSAAEEIVRAEVLARRAARSSGADGWDRELGSMARRDEALRALLRTGAQRAAFDANAADQRRLLEEVRRTGERRRAGGPPGAD